MRFAITCVFHVSSFPDVSFFPDLFSPHSYIYSLAVLLYCSIVSLRFYHFSSPGCLFSALSPICSPLLTVGRFSNIHYFHQGQCNPTGSAKDLAGADKGLAPDTVIT